MIMTLRSSLSASVRMFSLRDSNMDKDKAFLFLGLFNMILLEKETVPVGLKCIIISLIHMCMRPRKYLDNTLNS